MLLNAVVTGASFSVLSGPTARGAFGEDYGQIDPIVWNRLSPDEVIASKYAIAHSEKHRFDNSFEPPPFPELMQALREAKKQGIPDANMEFHIWLVGIKLQHREQACIRAGYVDMSRFYSVPVDDHFRVINKWLTDIYCEANTLARVPEMCAVLPAFQAQFPKAFDYFLRHEAEMAPCFQPVIFGLAHKRGLLRKEMWRERRFIFYRGMMIYTKPGGTEIQGFAELYGAHVTPAEDQSRPHSIDLYAIRPLTRVFLLSVDTELDVERWRMQVDLHRRFCIHHSDVIPRGEVKQQLQAVVNELK
eukprot:TRINITY_DN10603_c0_g1_i1.p1 TRINITY_DN10603_c0_g1~~TRINITY_DN10603_c0_g1_i1.p1  ORF type:complete len:303 (+),score=42.43 TRINITY_DN10603_c0_g1_i1:49-957(+)